MSAQPREYGFGKKYSQANNAEKHFVRSKVIDVAILEGKENEMEGQQRGTPAHLRMFSGLMQQPIGDTTQYTRSMGKY